MSNTKLKQANEEETHYIQLVYDYLNEKCAFDYANAIGVSDWQFCYFCAGQTPTSDSNVCAICMINREDNENHE